MHPDKNKNDPSFHNKIVSVNQAYSILSNPSLKKEYDFSIINKFLLVIKIL